MFKLYFHELPLVLFTILAQISAGMAFTFFIFNIKNIGKVTLEEFKKTYLILAITMGIALVISCFHLSNVFAGIYTLTRIFSNWLPVEVFSLAAFTGISLLMYLLIHFNKIGEKAASLAINLIVILAIIGLLAMTGIYGSMYSTVIAWKFKYVILLFFIISLLLGGLAFSFLPLSIAEAKYRVSYLVSLTGFFLFIIVLPLYMVYLGSTNPYNLRSIFDYSPLYSLLLSIGLIFTVIGFAFMIFTGSIHKQNIRIIFICVLIGQLIIRSLFYSLINTHLM